TLAVLTSGALTAREISGILHLLSTLSPDIESVSSSEAYVDLKGCERLYGTWSAGPLGHLPFSISTSGTYIRHEDDCIPPARRILPPRRLRWVTALGAWLQRKVRRKTGLPLSVGCANNALVARCASHFIAPRGLGLIEPGAEEQFFRLLPLHNIPGIGTTIISKFHKWNVHTVAEAQELSPVLLCKTFGPTRGRKVGALLHGRQNVETTSSVLPRSIQRERSFWEPSNNRAFVEAMLHYLVEVVGDELRHRQLTAGKVHIKVQHPNSRSIRRRRPLNGQTDENRRIFEVARQQLRRQWRRNHRVQTIGIAVSHLRPNEGHQTGLLDQNSDVHRRLDRCVDGLRSEFGFDAIRRGPSIQLGDNS
ncbi:MAG: DNA polymerase Y family protein, partial [Planctomycetota bacterium]